MKYRCCALALGLLMTLLPALPASAAVKAGDKCPKLKASAVVSGKKYTCIKSRKKLIWNKGQVNVITPVDLAPQLSPEKISTCQIKDQRPTSSGPYWEAIAYPVSDFNREQKLPVTGTAKVAFIPIDFSDVPGK